MKKFRIWDKAERELAGIHEYPARIIQDLFLGKGPDSLILQQFTGLKDKNDKEIFEGDIVKGKIHNYSKDSLKPVGLEDVLMECCYDQTEARYILKDITREGWGEWDFHDGMVDKIEIIGNIFENPELLKQNG